MPRRAAQTRNQEPASLPEVAIPLSEVPANQRSAYEIALIQDPEALKAALSQEDFFPMLASFPEAWWERLSLYLYRRPDDEGRMVKNDGQRKYIAVLRQPATEDYIAKRWGGGKYTLYLKLDSKETLRENTFMIDGAPKVLPGQFVEIDGKPVSVGATAATVPVPAETTDVAKVIAASAEASAQTQGLAIDGAKAVIEMVKEQAIAQQQPQKDPLETAIRLMEVMKSSAPQAPTADPMTTALTLMEKLDGIIARRNPQVEAEPKETPLDDAIGMVEKVTGKQLSDILKGSRAAPENEYAWVAPIANLGMQFLGRLPDIMRELRASKDLEFQRALYLANLQKGNVAPPNLPTPQLPPEAQSQPAQQHPAAPQSPAPADPGQLVQSMVAIICQGFDRHRDTGDDIAAFLAVQFGEQVEAFGIERTLSNPAEMEIFIHGTPELAQRAKDARWPEFRDAFLAYTAERWGMPEGDESNGAIQMPSVPRTPLPENNKPPAA